MNKLTNLILLIFLMLSANLSVISQPPKWYQKLRQVKPMTTTRQEVEKIFGNPKITYIFDGEWSKRIEYKIKNVKEGELSVSYSQGKCSEMKTGGYDVAKDVVLKITIYMGESFDISAFGFDLNNFKKMKIEDIVGLYTYNNVNSGEYFNGTNEKLRDFTLNPSKTQENLQCKN